MKRGITAFFAAILMTSLLVSCGEKNEHGAYKGIYERYNNMESFYAEAEISVISDKTENIYHARQFYKSPDAFAVVIDAPEEVAGSGYAFRNGKVTIKSGFGVSETVAIALPDTKNTICLADFVAEYYKSEEASVSAENSLTESISVMECFLNGKDENRFSQRLYIDNETYLPVKLVTYDINGNERVVVTYRDFKRNCEIEESNFE